MQVKDANRNRRSVGVLAAACFVAQLALAPGITLASGQANFAFVCAATIALSIGGRTGVIAGFVAGVLYDFSATGPVGLMAMLLTALSYLLGIESRDRISDEPFRTLVIVAIAALVVSLIYHLAMLVFGFSTSIIDVVLLRALPSALLTTLGYLPVMVILGRSGSGGKQGGHYSIGRS